MPEIVSVVVYLNIDFQVFPFESLGCSVFVCAVGIGQSDYFALNWLFGVN